MSSICSCHPPHGASATLLAQHCLGWTQSELLLSLLQLPGDKDGVSGGEPGRLSPVLGSSCGCYLSPSSHSHNEFSPVSAIIGLERSPPPVVKAQGGDAWLSKAVLAAGRCVEVVWSCRDGELWWDPDGPGPLLPTSRVSAQRGQPDEERSPSVLLTPGLLPCQGSHQCRGILLQQH